MNHRKRLQEIADFLQPYQRIWQNEIMLMYPDPLRDYPEEWVRELASFENKEDIIKLEKKEVKGLIRNPGLVEFYQRIEELCRLPSMPDLPPMPEGPFTFLHAIPKKQHEIRRLAPFINAYYTTKDCHQILDIGGGIGLLAQTLVNQYNLKVTSLDMDPVLQKTGHDRHQKNHRHADNKVRYLNFKVSADSKEFVDLISEKTVLVGLHTCGGLAVDQMRALAKIEKGHLINFGCCYHKLGKDGRDQNISEFAKELPSSIRQSPYALTLASRAHRKMHEKDYDFKIKVKFYRYAFHFLLHDQYDLHHMVTLGNSHPRLYDEPFGVYALEQLKRLEMAPKHSWETFNAYFERPETQGLIKNMLAAGLIRNALGRLLELYLLLDRAIFLEEQGLRVELYEFFDEPLSPRNIGIVAGHI